MAPDRVRRRVPWWLWAIGAIVVVIGVIAAIGGFNDVPISRVPTIALGSTFHANARAVLDAFAGLPLLNRRHCWDTLAVVSRYRQTGRLVYFRRSDRR